MPEQRRLRLADRCDRCGAQAFVRVVFGEDGMRWLDFCGHHFTKHEIVLRWVAEDIYDERKWINDQPSQSATV